MTKKRALSDKMRDLAESGEAAGVPLTDLVKKDLLEKADKLDLTEIGFFHMTPQTHTVQQFLGCWARARRLYCDLTGEPLV